MRSRISVLGWVHFVALLLALVATILSFSGRNGPPRTPADLSNTENSSREQSAVANYGVRLSNLSSTGRAAYPYSVIPGGVESAQELKYAVLHDPVVAGHYAGFDLAKARIVRLDRDRTMYVSYRLGDRVYWTNKTLKLLKGETLITDGVNEARTRCGNRLSETAAEPVSPEQPPTQILAAPEAPILVAGNQPPPESPLAPLSPPSPVPATPPDTPPTGGIIPPVIWPIIPGGPGSPHHPNTPPPPPPTPPPPVLVPEPDTSALLAIGLLGLLATGRLRWIRTKRKS